MRKTHVHDPVIDRLITGDLEIVYNILYLIRENEQAFVWTDDHICVAAQSKPGTSLWIALTDRPGDALQAELAVLIAERYALNPGLEITLDTRFAADVMHRAATLLGRAAHEKMPMNVYGCRAVKDLPLRGEIAVSATEDVSVMAHLLQQESYDAEGIVVSDEEALEWADDKVGSDRLLLLRDSGETVAMARVARVNGPYARIAPVVTERAYRGRGYAPMLVSVLCKTLLDKGITPMLYADAKYPASNRAYQKVGFERVGQVTTYTLK